MVLKLPLYFSPNLVLWVGMVLLPGYREARDRQLMGVARAGTLKFARAGPAGINMPAADLYVIAPG